MTEKYSSVCLKHAAKFALYRFGYLCLHFLLMIHSRSKNRENKSPKMYAFRISRNQRRSEHANDTVVRCSPNRNQFLSDDFSFLLCTVLSAHDRRLTGSIVIHKTCPSESMHNKIVVQWFRERGRCILFQKWSVARSVSYLCPFRMNRIDRRRPTGSIDAVRRCWLRSRRGRLNSHVRP